LLRSRSRSVLLLAAAVVAAGFVPWNLTAHLEGLCRRLGPPVAGWQVTRGEARWTPWSRLELSKLEVRIGAGGRLFLERVEVRPRLWTLALGGWETAWRFGEVRMEPDSWGIRPQPAREILSAEPAADGGSAVMQLRQGRWILKQLAVHGSLIRLDGSGWLAKDRREGELALKGELSGRLLQGEEFQPWEPFDLRVRGVLAAPEIRFTSNFFTFAMSPKAENGP